MGQIHKEDSRPTFCFQSFKVSGCVQCETNYEGKHDAQSQEWYGKPRVDNAGHKDTRNGIGNLTEHNC